MGRVFALFLLLFAAMYVAAEATLERPKKDGIVRLRWATDDNPARKVQTGGFAKMFPGTEVRVDPGLGGDQVKLMVQCATGTGPDIVDVYSKSQMQTLVEAGILMDLTDLAPQLGIDPSKTYPALRDGLLVEGRQYRFPCNVWANCIIFNKAIFDDHGLPYPTSDWTYEDFIAVGKKLRETPSKSGEKHLAVANWNTLGFVQDMLIGQGGRLFTADGLRSALDSPEAVAAMRLYYEMMHVHHILPTAAEAAAMSAQGGWGGQGLNWFSGEKAAMIVIGRWFLIQVPNFPALKGKLGAVLLPRVGDRASAGAADTRAAGINAKSPRRNEALKFLQYLASPEYSRLIVHDGDSLPPSPDVARDGKALVNTIEADPAFHQPFVDAMKTARPLDFSPFIDSEQVNRWFGEQVQKVENQLLSPEAAMRELAGEINAQIRVNLERRPDLQRKFAKVTGRPYTKDWWRAQQP